MTATCKTQPMHKRRSVLSLLMGLLLFEMMAWAALRFEIDRELGFGALFWGLVILALATCFCVWFVVRALVRRRGWFTLKEFLIFMFLVGSLLGWVGNWLQKTRSQRLIAQALEARGAIVGFDEDDQPWGRLLGHQYFHGVRHISTHTTQLTREDVPMLAGLPDLESLYLRGDITDDYLQHLQAPVLRFLYFEAAHIEASGLAALRGHRNLQNIVFESCVLDSGALAHLPKISNLKSVSLRNTPVDGDGLAHLQQCAQLKGLGLKGTTVTNAGLASLAGIANLSGLGLQGPAVTDTVLAHLGDLERLTSLDLYDTAITDAGLEHVAKLTNLQSLNLINTSVSDAGIVQLRSLKQLTLLQVQDTSVTAAGVSDLLLELPQLRVIQ